MYNKNNLYVHFETPTLTTDQNFVQVFRSAKRVDDTSVDLGGITVNLNDGTADQAGATVYKNAKDDGLAFDLILPWEQDAKIKVGQTVYAEFLAYFGGEWAVWNMSEAEAAAYAHTHGTTAFGNVTLAAADGTNADTADATGLFVAASILTGAACFAIGKKKKSK